MGDNGMLPYPKARLEKEAQIQTIDTEACSMFEACAGAR